MGTSTTTWSLGGWQGPSARGADPATGGRAAADLSLRVRTRVLRVVALSRTRSWVYLESLGWRRLPAADGLQPLLARCCRARLHHQQVDAEVSATHLLALDT
jgi:hypothetical protein